MESYHAYQVKMLDCKLDLKLMILKLAKLLKHEQLMPGVDSKVWACYRMLQPMVA